MEKIENDITVSKWVLIQSGQKYPKFRNKFQLKMSARAQKIFEKKTSLWVSVIRVRESILVTLCLYHSRRQPHYASSAC